MNEITTDWDFAAAEELDLAEDRAADWAARDAARVQWTPPFWSWRVFGTGGSAGRELRSAGYERRRPAGAEVLPPTFF